jgi:hypothetical protein
MNSLPHFFGSPRHALIDGDASVVMSKVKEAQFLKADWGL